MNDFKLGDVVVVNNCYTNRELIGLNGKVICFDSPDIGIQFKIKVDRCHGCHGRGIHGYCYYFRREDLFIVSNETIKIGDYVKYNGVDDRFFRISGSVDCIDEKGYCSIIRGYRFHKSELIKINKVTKEIGDFVRNEDIQELFNKVNKETSYNVNRRKYIKLDQNF